MFAGGSAVVAGEGLVIGGGGVALDAEALAGIGRNFQGLAVLRHLRDGKLAGGDVRFLAAVVERGGSGLWRLRRVNLMAGEAGDRGAVGKLGLEQFPRPRLVQRRDQIAGCPFEEHAMAADAIAAQLFAVVLFFIEEDAGKCRGMPAGAPAGLLGGVADAAAIADGQDLLVIEMETVGRLWREVTDQPVHVFLEGMDIQRERAAVAVAAVDIFVR